MGPGGAAAFPWAGASVGDPFLFALEWWQNAAETSDADNPCGCLQFSPVG